MNTPSLIKMFNTTASHDDVAKATFHRVGRNVMRLLAKELWLAPKEFDVRSCLGGIAVSGEVILHADWIYVDLSQSCIGPGATVMYRTCQGRADYTGGRNNFTSVERLLNIPEFATTLNKLRVAPESEKLRRSA